MPRSLPPFLSFFSRASDRGPGVPTNYIAGHKDTSDDFSCFSVTVAELLSRRNVDYLTNINFLSRARISIVLSTFRHVFFVRTLKIEYVESRVCALVR